MTAKKAEKATKKQVLYFERLTDKELRVLTALNGSGRSTAKAMSLSEILEATGWKKAKGVKRGNWTVRNAIRRIREYGWVLWVKKGVYKISARGRKQLKKPTPMPKKAAAPKKKASKKAAAPKKASKNGKKATKKNSKTLSIIPAMSRKTKPRPRARA